MQRNIVYKTITITPSIGQFIINELPLLLVCGAGFIYAGMDEMPFTRIALLLSVLLMVYLLYKLFYLKRLKYLIGSEQFVFEHGIFQRQIEYLELYRIVDFNEHQTFMQQLCGLKTISVFSGDRSTPKLDIIGVQADESYVSLLRERVIYNRKVNSIYEITNR